MAMPAGRGRVGQSNLTMKGSPQRLQCGQKGATRHAASLASELLYNTMRVTSIEKMKGGYIHLAYLLGGLDHIELRTIEYFSVNSCKELDCDSECFDEVI